MVERKLSATVRKTYIRAAALILPLIIISSAERITAKSQDDLTATNPIRIEGAVTGTGIVVGKSGNTYSALTAWHVISPNNNGEEVGIKFNGNTVGSIKANKGLNIIRIGESDMAIIKFNSSAQIRPAQLAQPSQIARGQGTTVLGFPNSDAGDLTTSKGKLVAYANTSIDSGYQLLYTNQTHPGMSGGPIFSEDNKLIGIHGRGEKDILNKNASETFRKTGINQGMPITHYLGHINGSKMSNNPPSSYDDYFAITIEAARLKKPQTIIRFAEKMIKEFPERIEGYIQLILVKRNYDIGSAEEIEKLRISTHRLIIKYQDLLRKAANLIGIDNDEAINLAREAEKIIQIFSESETIFAWAYLSKEDYEKAIHYGERAIEVYQHAGLTGSNPGLLLRDIPAVRENMYWVVGWAMYNLQDWKGAERNLTISLWEAKFRDSKYNPMIHKYIMDAIIKGKIRTRGTLGTACHHYKTFYSSSTEKEETTSQLFYPCSDMPLARDMRKNFRESICNLKSEGIGDKDQVLSMRDFFQEEWNLVLEIAFWHAVDLFESAKKDICPQAFK